MKLAVSLQREFAGAIEESRSKGWLFSVWRQVPTAKRDPSTARVEDFPILCQTARGIFKGEKLEEETILRDVGGCGRNRNRRAAQVKNFVPVTPAMLLNPSPDDWLMYSRTYDAQRYSPLNQINRGNVSKLALVWKNDLATGTIEIIPLVHNGVMYVEVPVRYDNMARTAVQALDATNGNLIWEYKRPTGGAARPKTLAIFEDIVIFAAPDNVIVGLDAATGKVRWEEKTTRGLSSGTVVFGDKVITGGTCNGARANCFIAANDARTGKEVRRFYTAAGSDDPIGDASWGGAPEAGRTASTWGLGKAAECGLSIARPDNSSGRIPSHTQSRIFSSRIST
jgi:hypothetical protein